VLNQQETVARGGGLESRSGPQHANQWLSRVAENKEDGNALLKKEFISWSRRQKRTFPGGQKVPKETPKARLRGGKKPCKKKKRKQKNHDDKHRHGDVDLGLHAKALWQETFRDANLYREEVPFYREGPDTHKSQGG